MSSVPSAVRLQGLTRKFDTLTAVDALDLEVRRGEFFSLLGPSGCGKSTVLRMIAGLLPESVGRVWLGDTDVTPLPAHRRPVSTVFQDYALFPHLNVAENVAFGLRERGVRGARARSAVDAVLAQVSLAGREKPRPRELSGGQRQRVALARSLVLRPDVLLLDEPLGALDLAMRKQMQSLLKQLQRETGITFIHVTHDQAEAFAISDRVAIMADGRLQQVGTPREVYRQPANSFVASFVGEVNRLPARISAVRDGHCYEVELDGGRVALIPGDPGSVRGAEVDILVRPEDLSLADWGTNAVTMDATVVDLVFHGPVTVVWLRLANGQVVTSAAATRTADALAVGSLVRAGWQPRDSWLLPTLTLPRTGG